MNSRRLSHVKDKEDGKLKNNNQTIEQIQQHKNIKIKKIPINQAKKSKN